MVLIGKTRTFGKLCQMVGLLLALSCSSSLAKDWAIVVGIDDYENFLPAAQTKSGHTDLAGARNDGLAIAAALRGAGVELPANRLLLDEDATREKFLRAWEELTTSAAPGDTIIVTFAGHGGQEEEVSEPFDEESDGRDETLMFHDFDPDNPVMGRLTDDQLRAMLEEASQFNIIWVMDSCHSGGISRTTSKIASGRSRNGGLWDIPLENVTADPVKGVGDGERKELPHVTQIMATASESKQVNETAFDGVKHGALSYFFAKAIGGEADSNRDDVITRAELSEYIEDRVLTHMDGKQQPTFLPRGDDRKAIGSKIAEAKPNNLVAAGLDTFRVKFIGSIPSEFSSDCPSCILVKDAVDIAFEQSGNEWKVYSGTGDFITTTDGDFAAHIGRARFLSSLNARKATELPPVQITAMQSTAERHEIGDIVGWNFAPPTPGQPFLTLFNVASDGTVQYGLVPPDHYHESDPVSESVNLKFRVYPPSGVDQLVAVFCSHQPTALQQLLTSLQGQTVPKFARLSAFLDGNTCQWGKAGLFTESS